MNIKHIIASVSLLAVAGVALADSGKTRAEVQAEVIQARAAGLLDQNELDYPVITSNAPALTRAQVQAEVIQARADGTLNQGETDYPRLATPVSTLTRAEVQAEVRQARADGRLTLNETAYPAGFEATHVAQRNLSAQLRAAVQAPSANQN